VRRLELLLFMRAQGLSYSHNSDHCVSPL
jgi:hypothetical protein